MGATAPATRQAPARQGPTCRAVDRAKRRFPEVRRELPALVANALTGAGTGRPFLSQVTVRMPGAVFSVWASCLRAQSFSQAAWNEGSFAPNSDVILASPGWAEATARDWFPAAFDGCDPNPANTWRTLSPPLPRRRPKGPTGTVSTDYAADLVVPILDLGQTDAWVPSRDRGFWGGGLWWARWVLAALGWVVTGLGIAAVTNVIQRNQPDQGFGQTLRNP